MNTKTSLIAFLTLTTLGGVMLAWHEYQHVVALEDAALKAGNRADLEKKIADLQKANRELEDELAAARLAGEDEPAESMAGASAPAENNGGPSRRPFGRGRQGFAAMQQLLAKPEVQALINSTEKAAIDARYAALFRSLNLSPEQADKLKQLLIDRENTRQDVLAAARDQGIDPRTDRDAFQKLLNDSRNSLNDNIKSLLGDQGYSQFTNYEQTMPQRNVVNMLQQRLSGSDAPLTASQSDQLVQILAANAPTEATGNAGGWRGGDFGGGPGRFGAALGGGGMGALASAPITPTAVSQASAVLNQSQLSALQQLQQQQQTAQQLQQLMRNAWQQNGAAGGGAAQPTGSTGGGGGGGGRRRGGG